MQTLVIKTISANSSVYPQEFTRLPQPPLLFYAQGNLSLLRHPIRLAIVGTRRISPYGKEVTEELARCAAANSVVIVSGLAYGVDIAAHQAALSLQAPVIAVLPSGLSSIYPTRHQHVAREILKTGGLLISEYRGATPPQKFQFVARNRLIAALSHAVLVTEAAAKSGSFHTVEFAQDMGKKIGAVPGSIYASESKGVNWLIKDGAEPILSASDLALFLGFNEKIMKPRYKAANKHEEAIITHLSAGSISTSQLLERSQLEISQLNVHLTMLEIKGVIGQTAAKKWKLMA